MLKYPWMYFEKIPYSSFRKILKITKYLSRELEPGLKFRCRHVLTAPSHGWALHLCAVLWEGLTEFRKVGL